MIETQGTIKVETVENFYGASIEALLECGYLCASELGDIYWDAGQHTPVNAVFLVVER
jgi:hypothetical protein|nr:MAG TPA: hypothetical protein [Caudoviricetes sp.]